MIPKAIIPTFLIWIGTETLFALSENFLSAVAFSAKYAAINMTIRNLHNSDGWRINRLILAVEPTGAVPNKANNSIRNKAAARYVTPLYLGAKGSKGSLCPNTGYPEAYIFATGILEKAHIRTMPRNEACTISNPSGRSSTGLAAPSKASTPMPFSTIIRGKNNISPHTFLFLPMMPVSKNATHQTAHIRIA